MVRLIDIARKAGVSIMTVSRVLRDAPDISSTTKARVRALAQQMGYVPDVMARGLRTRQTRLLGVVVPNVNDPVTARVVSALAERAHDLGYDLLLDQSQSQAEREEVGIRRLMARRVEGLFLSPVYRHAPSAPVYAELQQRRTRVVLLGPKAPFCQMFPNVQIDDLPAAHQATAHLIALGHRRIAFLAGPSTSPAAQGRFDGYRRALREAGLELDDHLVFHAGTTVEDGAKAVTQMLNEHTRVTALQAVNDLVAMGAANLLLEQGVRIPDDLAVVGFGNIPGSECFRVPLTTTRQPKYQLGLAAMAMMQSLLKGDTVNPRRLPAELIIRASTGPAKPTAPELPAPAPGADSKPQSSAAEI